MAVSIVNPSGRTVEVDEAHPCVAFAKAGLHGWAMPASAEPAPEPEPEPTEAPTEAKPKKGKGK